MRERKRDKEYEIERGGMRREREGGQMREIEKTGDTGGGREEKGKGEKMT